MSDNSTDILNTLQSAFTEFKSANDARLAEIEKKGAADVLLNEKVDRLNDALTELERKNARPALNAKDVEESEYKSAFLNDFARKGVEMKGVNVTTAADGGVLLPEQIEAGIYTELRTYSPIRSLANVVPVSTQDYKFLKQTTGAASGWVGEAAARPETVAPKFAEVNVPMGELYGNVFATQRSLDDLTFNLEAHLQNEVGIDFAAKEGLAFLKGTGSDQPKGILTETDLTTVNSKAAANLGAGHDFAINMIQAMSAPYRAGAAFFGASTSVGAVRTQKTADGAYYWSPSTVVGTPSTLMGHAFYELEDMDAIGAGAFPIMFANLKQGYTIADRAGITVLRDPYSNKPHVSFYMTKRVGGIVKDKKAFVLLKIAA